MDFLQKLKTFLPSIVAFYPELDQQRSQPEQPANSSIDIESPQQQRLPSPSPSSPSLSYESPQSQLPSPASAPTTPSNLKPQQESLLACQQHLQWQNAVLAFCFSYALSVSLQFVGTDQSNHQLHFNLVLLSFLVLLTFTLILVAFFIHPNCTRASQALEKVAFLFAAAAFCLTLSIPFSFELKCAIWAVFLLSLLILIIFKFLNHKTARCLFAVHY
ncbi:hypothetical protein REPUB_Repub05bG0156500 [Reevesia pubescens]